MERFRCPEKTRFGFKLSTRLFSALGELCLNISSKHQIARVGRIQPDLHLAMKPGAMLGGILLLFDELAHEVTQKLGTSPVAGLRSRCKIFFQLFFNPEGESRFIHCTQPNGQGHVDLDVAQRFPALGLLGTTDHVCNAAMRRDALKGRPNTVSGVCTQMLAASVRWRLALDHDRLEHRIELRSVMPNGPGHDGRQRHATAAHSKVPLAPIFPPSVGLAQTTSPAYFAYFAYFANGALSMASSTPGHLQNCLRTLCQSVSAEITLGEATTPGDLSTILVMRGPHSQR